MSRRSRLLIRSAPALALALVSASVPTEAAQPALSPAKVIELAQAPAAAPQAPAAQPKGRVRIQGRDVLEAAPAPLPPPPGLQIDTRQQMRKFLQSITTVARLHNRNFSVIVMSGLELLIKRDPADETRYSPARTYMRSIDGVMVDGLFFGNKVFGEPTSSVKAQRNLRFAEIAKANGLKVFVMDYGTDPQTINESNRRNKKRGYVSTTLHAPLAELGSLPPYPARPYGESPNSILSLKNVNTFAYITNSAAFGRPDEFAMKMHGTNYDLLIVDVLHGRKPLSRQAVETLKFKKIGARRLVFATVNIGTAASYRYYWKTTWREGSPAWIKAPVRDDPDRYHVEFWRPEWQRIISGDTKSYVYGLIALGFDGVILEGIKESYRFFEGGGEPEEEESAPPPATAAAAPPAAAAPQPPAQAPAATAQ